MPAYLVIEHIITDATVFDDYRVKTGVLIKKHCGRYLTNGGHFFLEPGVWSPNRVSIVEFPSVDNIKQLYDDPDYKELIPLRKRSAIDMLIAIDGST